MIDSHCHIDFKEYKDRLDETVQAAISAGVHTLVNIGADLQTSRNSVQLSDKYDNVYAAVGVHPHDAQKYDAEVEAEIIELSKHNRVKAIGEIGLDFYRDLSPRDIQEKVFRKQLDIAADKKMPIVIHTRDSFEPTLKIVKEYNRDLVGGVFHCFPGSVEDAFEVIELGFHIGIGGVVTFPKAKMAEVATRVPLSSILLETDSPYLTPVPYRGKTNQPAYVQYVRDRVAELRGVSKEEVEKATDRNSQKMYRLVDLFGG